VTGGVRLQRAMTGRAHSYCIATRIATLN
jgi:hypothetical protein